MSLFLMENARRMILNIALMEMLELYYLIVLLKTRYKCSFKQLITKNSIKIINYQLTP